MGSLQVADLQVNPVALRPCFSAVCCDHAIPLTIARARSLIFSPRSASRWIVRSLLPVASAVEAVNRSAVSRLLALLAVASLAGGQGSALARPVQVKAAKPAVVAPKPARPWLYENSDVPIDPAWLFGTLPNGLRYAIRSNAVPPGQISIRLRVDAGSLHERKDESGYAHFIEHLTFRGSKFVPDGESKRIWQRLGVSFGSDSNAQTTPTATTISTTCWKR